MNDLKNLGEHPQSVDLVEGEINLLDYLLVIVKHKKMIFLSCVVTFVLACGITFLMPNIYTSTARILPPQENQSGLSSMLGGMSDLASLAGISVGGVSGELYVGMLKSRTISDKIIDRFHLMEVYEQEYRVEMYDELDSVISISLGADDGIIAITVEDEDPARAAAIANAYVEELQNLNVKINLNSAGRERLFLDARLDGVKKDLRASEDNLKNFQKKNKAISIDAQTSAMIEAIATLKGELASKEIELGVLLASQTEQSPEVRVMHEAIAQLKEQLSRMLRSSGGKTEDIFVSTADVPELGIQYARLLRDFKIKETLFELLTKQDEMAKINEARNTSTIQILDEGTIADKKSKPRRSLIVLLATFIAGFLSVIYAFFHEYGQRMTEEDSALWQQVKQNMKFSRTTHK